MVVRPMSPVLIACSHGTRSARGAAAVADLVEAVRRAMHGTEVVGTWVDVQEPALPEVTDRVADRPAVVVPLLLSAGYHVHHDIASAVAARPGHVAARPLGPDPVVTDLLVSRLAEKGLAADDVVVLGASASSDPRALEDLRATAAALSARLRRPVELGHVGHCGAQLSDVVARVRRHGRRVVVATHLLAPGHFHDAIARTGADAVTAPLLDERRPDPRLVSLVVRRYAEALGRGLAAAG
ncbi:hypothetical protein AFL01nite_17580 [Aeromicrobium flavum]|uniref:Cobalamin biosynthesis protein CbiX n=1 Tax=Aeromicrobium flavum TaxID=416568 RepID=A0A512HVG3_9ACTN|nr:CbiX/SirB N-terminal domain-containing protein [Aeromicrobium flavum]GEO89431.1 hypothetical protein AFL01nite_17580 [Aeromicrobium flavum]